MSALDRDPLEDVRDRLACVDGAFERVEDVLPADQHHRVDAVREQRRDGRALEPVALVLQAVDLDQVVGELGAPALFAKVFVEGKYLLNLKPFDHRTTYAVCETPVFSPICLKKRPGLEYVLVLNPNQSAILSSRTRRPSSSARMFSRRALNNVKHSSST